MKNQQQQQQQTTTSSQGSMISNQSSVKTLKDSSYSTASSIASSKTSTENFGKNSEKPNTDADALTTTTTPSWVRGAGTTTPTNFGGSPNFGSPSIKRRQINQSPAPVDQESTTYRCPPTTPFQPGFYKKPPLEDKPDNPFPLSPKAARKVVKQPESKKMRRKMREAQMDAGCGSDSDEENNDFHP